MKDLHSKITTENGILFWKDRKIPLFSGEFHYWRVPADHWKDVADRILELGLNMVATYVPWNYHELKEGVFDFTGRTSPTRNLDGFLSLMARKGLYVMIRPGPYIYAEWPFGGPPERATKFARLDPRFLKMSGVYIDAVSKVIAPHQITRGGSVILCQSDNETYPELERCGTECGAFAKDGDFKDFLRRRYGNDIAALNRAWHSEYRSFAEPCLFFHEAIVDTGLPMAERLLPDTPYRVRYYDSLMFIGDYAARLVGTIGARLRKNGIDVPLTANGWSPLYQDFKVMTDTVDLCGSDIYPTLYMKGGGTVNGIRDDWFYNVDIIKQQEADSPRGNAWSAEFECGALNSGSTTAQQHRFITLFSVANGLKGLNYYMLVNRDNWAYAPINEWGRPTENFAPLQSAVAVVNRLRPWECSIRNDFALFACKAHRLIDPGNFKTVFDVLKTGTYTYRYFNPESADAPQEKILLYAGGDWIFRSDAEKLRRYVKNGGTLIAFNRFPCADEFGAPLELGFVEPDGVRPTFEPVGITAGKKMLRLTGRGHMGAKVNFFYYRGVKDAEPLTVTLSRDSSDLLIRIRNSNLESFEFGYIRKSGKGRIVHIGCGADSEVLRLVLESMGVKPAVDSCEKEVDFAVFDRADGKHFLSVLNRSSVPQRAGFRLTGLDGKKLRNLESGEEIQIEKKGVTTLTAKPVDVGFWEVL